MQAFLFGNFRIATDTQSEIELRPTASRLFAFLLLYRQNVHLREVVAEQFWTNTGIGRARKSLNTALWQLRIALHRTDSYKINVIATTNNKISINDDANLWLDVALFEERANRGMDHTKAGRASRAIGALEEAVALYQADLLTDIYDSWVLNERERLRLLYLRCLTQLMKHHQQDGAFNRSISYAQHILRIEPWREDIHRNLMTLFWENGRRAEAIDQFRRCRNILDEELAVPPQPETEALYRRIQNNTLSGYPLTVSPPSRSAVSIFSGSQVPQMLEATAQLQEAIQTLQAAQQALERAVAVVEHLTGSVSSAETEQDSTTRANAAPQPDFDSGVIAA